MTYLDNVMLDVISTLSGFPRVNDYFRNGINFLINYCVFQCLLPAAVMAAVLDYWQFYVSLIFFYLS